VCPAPAGSRRTLRAAAAVIEKLGDRSQACHASGPFLEASYVSAPRRTREPAMSDNVYHSLILAACALLLQPASPAGAACNLIPGTSLTFNSALGATNRPFAAPNENLEITVRGCDASPGLTATATDHLVTVLFTPPTGPAHAVVLTADADCTK